MTKFIALIAMTAVVITAVGVFADTAQKNADVPQGPVVYAVSH